MRNLKWKQMALCLLCCLSLILSGIPASAAQYDDSIWRFNDFVGVVNEEEETELDDLAFELIEELSFDFPVCILDDLEEDTLTDFADWFYEHNGFGWGSEMDGVLLVLDLGAYTYDIVGYGRGAAIFSGEALENLGERFADDFNEGTPYDAFRNYYENAAALVREDGSTGTPRELEQAENVEQFLLGEDGSDGTETSEPEAPSRPDWYPEDVSAFVNFHGENLPGVVDDADIFTDGQERLLSAKIAEIKAKHPEMDFVVFTDVSTYGLSRGVYAADFYVFNGYGVGDDYNGLVLFICMQPGNRGWWTAATGSSRRLITESNLNDIDDRLEPYMVEGNYFQGVSNYLDDMDTLYRTGHVPRDTEYYVTSGMFSLGGGAILAAIVLAILRSKTRGLNKVTDADSYLVPGSFALTASEDTFNRKVVTKTVRETESRSGGGGGSSYSGGYSSSSGSSFSGGGRSF